MKTFKDEITTFLVVQLGGFNVAINDYWIILLKIRLENNRFQLY